MNKEKTLRLGPMNEHATGIVLKEVSRRAAEQIRSETLVFESKIKPGYRGKMDDVCTSADRKAQAIYLRTLRECFPDCGIIAEEENLRIEPKNGCTIYFTVDPLDGTRAYIRRQSDGVGTMIGMIDGKEVIAAYIGDINTGEVYGYRPLSRHVHRITRLNAFEELGCNPDMQREDSYILLREPTDYYSRSARRIVSRFKSHMVYSSSIGIWAARLWKGEVMALLLPPGIETPWDAAPIIGISLKLGCAFARPAGRGWERYQPRIERDVYERNHETLIMFEKHINQVI